MVLRLDGKTGIGIRNLQRRSRPNFVDQETEDGHFGHRVPWRSVNLDLVVFLLLNQRQPAGAPIHPVSVIALAEVKQLDRSSLLHHSDAPLLLLSAVHPTGH